MGLFFIGKNMDSNGALKQLQDFNATRKSAGDYYTDASNQLGVGAAQQQANDLRGTIRNTEAALKAVPASVSGRTQGSLVTEAQRARLQNIESDPIAQRLGEQNTQYGDQMTQYRDLLGQAQTRSGLAYQGDTDKARSLQDYYQNVLGQESATEEKRRWEEQFNYQRQQDAAKAAQMAAQTASLNSRINASNSGTDWQKIIDAMNKSGNSSTEQVLKSFTNKAGDSIGYDTNRASYLTDQGAKEYYSDLDPSPLNKFSNAVSKYGPLTLFGKGLFY